MAVGMGVPAMRGGCDKQTMREMGSLRQQYASAVQQVK